MLRNVVISFLLMVIAGVSALQAHAQSLIRDAEIEAILREYTDPILRAAGLVPEDVKIFLIGDKSLNAFVANGQRIHLNTGLIITAETPGQLKGVIAHETGHIAGAHGARRAQDLAIARRPAYISIGLGIIAIAAGAPQLGAALIVGSQEYAALNFFAHTRVQEASADQAAVTYLEKIGESPSGLVEFFDNFRYQESISQAKRFPYFRSHPLASDRIQALRLRAEETGLMDVPPTERAQHQFDMMQAKLIGFLETPGHVYRKYPLSDTSQPAMYARTISAFRAVDIQAALNEMENLLATDPDNPFFHELHGQILFETGRISDSIRPLERAVSLAPDEPLIQIAYARSLIARAEEGDVDAGEKALREAILIDPDNAFAWRELAIALEAQGLRDQAELATAESYYRIGDIVRANLFANRALNGLSRSSTYYIRASDIAAITDPRLPENKAAYRRSNNR
ncbi:MAG: M48 family metalloprotease [Pseudomonadota bacterium]